MKTTVLITALIALTCNVVRAVDSSSWLANGLVHPQIILNHQDELKLTAEQQSQLKAIVGTATPQVAPLETAVKQAQEKLETLLRNQDTAPAAGAEALTTVLNAETTLKQFQLKTMLELRSLLTPEQRTQALTLASQGGVDMSKLEAKVRAEAEKLKQAFESRGLPISDALKERGKEIEKMIKERGFKPALEAMEKLIAESGINDPAPTDPLDFSNLNSGDTNLEAMKARLEKVQAQAREVISVKVLERLKLAKSALEGAQSASDAELFGKILTFAEKIMEKKQ